MDRAIEKSTVVCLAFLMLTLNSFAGMLKVSDAPLSQVIELYSQETGRNVFVDEGVQKDRKVTAFLQGMPIEQAFEIIQKTLSLESCMIGTGTLLLYPPEKAQKYKPDSKTIVMSVPKGLDSKWVSGLYNNILPGLRTAPGVGDERSIVLYGPDGQIGEAEDLAKKLPELSIDTKNQPMPEGEAKLALIELKNEGVELEATPSGLFWRGKKEAVNKFSGKLYTWRKACKWTSQVYTPEYLEVARALKAAEASKGQALISDLGGTGSILIEGPVTDRFIILGILQSLDIQSEPQRYEFPLGELKPELAREAIRATGLTVQMVGERNLILIGRPKAVKNAAFILESLNKKRKQVLISLKLAEITKTRLKTLGVDLEKASFGYGEIKEYHPKDMLPLILRIVNEGKDGKILAEPNLRVIEGEEAKVIIGDKIPLEVSASAQTESGSTLKLNTQLNWVDVGIKMTVRNVQVNHDKSIKMALLGQVSSVIGTTKQGFPQIRTREAESILRLKNNSSVIMGGLLSREEREGNNWIPIISRIPIIGGFARSRNRDKTQSEIIMIVTARLTED